MGTEPATTLIDRLYQNMHLQVNSGFCLAHNVRHIEVDMVTSIQAKLRVTITLSLAKWDIFNWTGSRYKIDENRFLLF